MRLAVTRLSLLLGLVLPAVPARSQVVPVMGSEETGFGPVSEYAMLGWEVTEDGQVLVTRTRPTMIRVADWREAPVLPDGTLLDVASTVPGEPAVIYYNPLLLGRYQPDLQAFFLAYERAHVALGHRRGTALPIDTGGRARHLREQELEADCFAAQLAASPTASLAAGRFFARQGPVANDAEHPASSERAATIMGCVRITSETESPSPSS